MYKVFTDITQRDFQEQLNALTGMNIADIGVITPSGKMYAVAKTATTPKTYKLLVGVTPVELLAEIKAANGFGVKAVGPIGTVGQMYGLLESGDGAADYLVVVAPSAKELEREINDAPAGYSVVDTDVIGNSGWMYALLSDEEESPEPVLDTLNVTANGTYTPPSGIDGYDEVIVNVAPNLETKTVSIATLGAGGTIAPSVGYAGISLITLTE